MGEDALILERTERMEEGYDFRTDQALSETVGREKSGQSRGSNPGPPKSSKGALLLRY